MKKLFKHTFMALLAALLLLACTDGFEDMNTNPKGVTDEELKQDNNYVGMHYLPMMQSIYFNNGNGNWEYQLIQNLNADIFSGYMASGSSFAVSGNNMHYALNHGWNDYCWDYAYNQVMSPNLQARKKCEADLETYAHFNAITTIIRVLTMSRLCDQYGPIIYSKYGDSMTGGTYDSAEDAYKQFFAELEEAATALEDAMTKPVASFANFDIIYGGDLSKWAKMANSLRLRLAMRIVKYDADEARKQAEAAMAHSSGLILDNGENFIISASTYKHPLATLSVSWRDIFVSAEVTSILSGYQDSRLEKMVNPTGNGERIGLRNGLDGLDRFDYKAEDVVSTLKVNTETPVVLFPAAETHFLLAEAALRGWNTNGSAQSHYETGVQTSFDQWGASIGGYLNSVNKPADYVAPRFADYNIAAVETATPAWTDAATDEDRLRKIIVQKWIALFPEGMNAWAEQRRTGYPKLFPIQRNDSQGDQYIPTETGVRRLTFTVSERDNNPEGYADALVKLKGPDTGATRIFWDIDKPNI